eukprot:TRINITY_DN2415_c0_g2_i12.p1 TRINITY_DN2415_c0_g2~~TRINITY_DN2415_c0_g2_i12.p1  ORF type:complete len:439 (+),score=135.63 TRINITY_DN2415_c0_g2_i12:66-1382(+)
MLTEAQVLPWVLGTVLLLAVIIFFLRKKPPIGSFPSVDDILEDLKKKESKPSSSDSEETDESEEKEEQPKPKDEKPKTKKKRKFDLRMNIKICFLGDDKVGKTSFIQKVLDELDKNKEIPRMLEPVRLSKGNTTIDLIDTCNDSEFEEELKKNVSEANFIFILYDMKREETKISAKDRWLRLVQELRKDQMPKLAIIAMKADTEEDELPQEQLKPIAEWCEQYIEFVIVCSSSTGKNVETGVMIARDMLVNPTDPLFVIKGSKEFSPAFLKAIEDIFHHFDSDGKGFLSEADVIKFRKMVWGDDPKPGEIQGLKKTLSEAGSENLTDSDNGGGITSKGFTHLMRLFLVGKIKELWCLLREFGYDNQLNLTLHRYVDDPLTPPPSSPPPQGEEVKAKSSGDGSASPVKGGRESQGGEKETADKGKKKKKKKKKKKSTLR